ncbi:MAG: DoxX family protein [Terracidiphilus sp.]|jgi:putative oxidoreductase
MRSLELLRLGYLRSTQWISRLQSPLLLLIRLYWGWQFAQTGWGKLHNLAHVTEFFETLSIPAPHANALIVSATECVGGILLAIGLGSRAISLVLFVDMSVAYVAADREALASIIADPGKFYGADPYTFWFAALLILILGPGALAIDYILKKKLARTRPS